MALRCRYWPVYDHGRGQWYVQDQDKPGAVGGRYFGLRAEAHGYARDLEDGTVTR